MCCPGGHYTLILRRGNRFRREKRPAKVTGAQTEVQLAPPLPRGRARRSPWSVPISLSIDRLEFDLLYPAIKGDTIQLYLGAKLLDSQGKVTKWFNNSAASLTMPTLDNIPFSLIVSQDVVKAAVAAVLSPEEFMVLLDSVLPESAHRLKSSIGLINEKLQ
uniref:Isoform 2 of BPI fold-containing family B member 1 n=1 Tax=Homo sapiens TaxID=9606 RepID=Q8TDL5-2|nr:unnamed protein product [Homo sapiens]